MVFNWFRRQHNDTGEKPQEQASQPAPDQPQAQESQAEVVEKPSGEAAQQDYLNWAKAAYKNIQARQKAQQEETATVAAELDVAAAIPAPASESVTVTSLPSSDVESTTAVAETTESVMAAQTDSVPEAIAPQIPEPEIVASAIAPTPESSIPKQVVETAAIIPEQLVEPEAIALKAPETPAANVPFWAKDKDDRQGRLERLKATAIEIPEPEVQVAAATATTAPTIEEEIPELEFDDGFLWSARTLAAQGRRPEDISIEEITWLRKLRQGLDKTRRSLINQLKAIVGQGPLNQDAVGEIEALLLQADVGVEATDYIIKTLQSKLREEALPPEAAIAYLKEILRNMLNKPLDQTHKRSFAPEKETLNIWLITGVNGAGKTTTIGKLAHIAQKSGYKCLIGAADTFRAAAVEQVKVWGQRSGVEVVANPGKNTDPAAVVFDAIAAAKARDIELLLVDTAGRLQNKKNLMDELGKIRRIIDKQAQGATVESLLVLDATLGQNGLRQAQVFSEVAQLSGVVLTKLDGTAKGGVALAVVQQLGLPIRFIGAGEGIEDLRPFSSYEFVEALLSG